VRNDQRGFVDVPDDVGDRERFPGAGHAQEDLVRRAGHDAFGQLRNRLRLVTGRFVWRDKVEHGDIIEQVRGGRCAKISRLQRFGFRNAHDNK
jgi:hypothetical protein